MQNLSVPQNLKRAGAAVNVYLILKKGETILLSLRQNTGYCDGSYGLVSGHVEDGESATAAMIREAKEEADLIISPEELKLVHLMHRKTNRLNIDLFFECCFWEGSPINKEPIKCAQLAFYSMSQLPENIIPYIQKMLRIAYLQKQCYSEDGW